MASLTPADIAYMEAHADDNVQPNYIAACACGLGLAYIAVILRFASRRIIHAPLRADDWWLLVGVAMVTGYMIANFFSIHYGMGRHIIFVSSAKGLVQSNLAAEIIYAFSFIPIKTSILCLYCRLFNSKSLNRICICIGIFVACYSTTQGVAMILQCLPIPANWEGGGHCIRTDILFTLMASLNVVTDFILLVLPMRYIYQLKLPASARVQLAAIFALGGSACVFSIVRTIYVHSAGPYDASWNDAYGGIWSVIELCVGLICACLPTLRPLMSASVRRKAAQNSADYFKSDQSGGSGGKFIGSKGRVNAGTKFSLASKKNGWSNMRSYNDTVDEYDMREQLTKPAAMSMMDTRGMMQSDNSESTLPIQKPRPVQEPPGYIRVTKNFNVEHSDRP